MGLGDREDVGVRTHERSRDARCGGIGIGDAQQVGAGRGLLPTFDVRKPVEHTTRFVELRSSPHFKVAAEQLRAQLIRPP